MAILLAIPANFVLTRYFVRKRNSPSSHPTQIQVPHFDMKTEAHALEITAPPVPPQWEKFELLAPNRNPATCLAGSIHYFRVVVTNRSDHLLHSGLTHTPDNPKVNIAYRFFDSTGTTTVAESERYFLRHSLLPQKLIGTLPQLPVDGEIRCPDKPGDYIARIELVQEGVAWMSDVAGHGAIVERKIRSIAAAEPNTPREWINAVPISPGPNSNLNAPPPPAVASAFRIATHTLLGSLSVIWRGTVPYLIANAGSNYPMFWVRDLASIEVDLPGLLVADPKANSDGAQHHWTELFLAAQSSNGQIPDWIAPNRPVDGNFSDKNDVSSDQELWLVHSALQSLVSGLTSKSWLQLAVNGMTVQARLRRAVEYILQQRWDASKSCLWSGHTADWGDVGPIGVDVATATKLATSGPSRVCGIYTQALLFKVLLLAKPLLGSELDNLRVGNEGKTVSDILSSIRSFESASWDETRGMYRVHTHLNNHSPHRSDFDESSVFALGGNVLAVMSDLSPKDRALRILATILTLKKRSQNATVSASLIPPYPAGTFEVPIMDQPDEYQNGGLWDWHGARAVRQMTRFEMKSDAARELLAISELVAARGAVFEWYRVSKGEKPDEFVGPGFVAGAGAILSNLEVIRIPQ